MKVRYNLIRLGQVINSQAKELDGPPEVHTRQIESDQFNAMDPCILLRDGGSADWIEAIIEDRPDG